MQYTCEGCLSTAGPLGCPWHQQGYLVPISPVQIVISPQITLHPSLTLTGGTPC